MGGVGPPHVASGSHRKRADHGPQRDRLDRCAIAALADTGLDGSERMDAVAALSAHIRGTQSAGAAGTQPWATERRRELLLAHADRYPALTAVVSPSVTPHASSA